MKVILNREKDLPSPDFPTCLLLLEIHPEFHDNLKL